MPGKQLLELAVQGLAHGTVSHRLIAFDTVLQHHDFIYVLFHNRLGFVLSAFRKAVLHLFFYSLLITLQRYELFAENMFYNIKILLISLSGGWIWAVLPYGDYRNIAYLCPCIQIRI